jgi:hypothetical protein
MADQVVASSTTKKRKAPDQKTNANAKDALAQLFVNKVKTSPVEEIEGDSSAKLTVGTHHVKNMISSIKVLASGDSPLTITFSNDPVSALKFFTFTNQGAVGIVLQFPDDSFDSPNGPKEPIMGVFKLPSSKQLEQFNSTSKLTISTDGSKLVFAGTQGRRRITLSIDPIHAVIEEPNWKELLNTVYIRVNYDDIDSILQSMSAIFEISFEKATSHLVFRARSVDSDTTQTLELERDAAMALSKISVKQKFALVHFSPVIKFAKIIGTYIEIGISDDKDDKPIHFRSGSFLNVFIASQAPTSL